MSRKITQLNKEIHQPSPALDASQCWQAVLTRDLNADRAFVYAVRSTGVYCRASCPARRPRPNQVVFFASQEAAEKAGFRPCLRCRPREASLHAVVVLRICRFIEEHLEEQIDLAALSGEVGMSPFHLQRIFKRAMGVSPREYADVCRFQAYKQHLKKEQSITAALYAAGYGSSSRAYQRTALRLGMTPARYRRGGQDAQIHYAIGGCPLGKLLVAATERGICAINLGASDVALEAALRQEYPGAAIDSDEKKMEPWMNILQRHLHGEQPRLDLPLDVRATAFQWRVWSVLRSIPYGQTRSYSQIARTIGKPTAIRAVARACASNPAALLVPCHRAVREDGRLGGYRWGLKRKQALLAGERKRV